jgi:AmiR/NasT family two-component response regulator
LVLIYLKMEEVDCQAILAWIREHLLDRPPRIIDLTGSGEIRDIERVKPAAVAAGYFVKPLLPQHVASILPADPKRAAQSPTQRTR